MDITNLICEHLKVDPATFWKDNPELAKKALLKCLIKKDLEGMKFFGEHIDVNFGNEYKNSINPLIYSEIIGRR